MVSNCPTGKVNSFVSLKMRNTQNKETKKKMCPNKSYCFESLRRKPDVEWERIITKDESWTEPGFGVYLLDEIQLATISFIFRAMEILWPNRSMGECRRRVVERDYVRFSLLKFVFKRKSTECRHSQYQPNNQNKTTFCADYFYSHFLLVFLKSGHNFGISIQLC